MLNDIANQTKYSGTWGDTTSGFYTLKPIFGFYN
jgi:hypothetical protein